MTLAGVFLRVFAAARPPKPPPTITTRGTRLFITFKIYLKCRATSIWPWRDFGLPHVSDGLVVLSRQFHVAELSVEGVHLDTSTGTPDSSGGGPCDIFALPDKSGVPVVAPFPLRSVESDQTAVCGFPDGGRSARNIEFFQQALCV